MWKKCTIRSVQGLFQTWEDYSKIFKADERWKECV